MIVIVVISCAVVLLVASQNKNRSCANYRETFVAGIVIVNLLAVYSNSYI